jgi:hypothetical protein
MGRALRVINSEADRAVVLSWAMKAPVGTRVTFQRVKRSLPQNDKLWACLSDVAEQVDWHGEKLTTGDWKDIFTANLRKTRLVHGIDPGSFVLLGLHTSDMDKDELSMLIDLIHAFGAEHEVVFHDHLASEEAA